MKQYLSIAQVKGRAREHLLGRYRSCISAFLTIQMVGLLLSSLIGRVCDRSTMIGWFVFILLQFLVSLVLGIFESGQYYLYLNVACKRPILSIFILQGFFTHPDKAILIRLYLIGCSFVSSLPIILIAALSPTASGEFPTLAIGFSILWLVFLAWLYSSYGQTLYLLHDFPDHSAAELLRMSRHYMQGHKLRYIRLYLSFIPLLLLGVLSLGIGFLWVVPYLCTSQAEFFLDLMQE